MDLARKRILVTGATGLIGGRLIERLREHPDVSIRALARDPAKADRLRAPSVEIAIGDITRPETLPAALAGCHVVVHCAARVTERGSWEEFWRSNVEGTRHVLEAAAHAGVERFVHVSSVAVYGIFPRDQTDETFPYQPCGNAYCDTKIEAEKVALEYFRQRGVPLVILRPGIVYGPHSRHWTIRIIELLKTNRLFLLGRADGICNHVYVDNVVDAILLAMTRDDAVGEAFIITDGEATTWREFFGHYARMLGRDSIPQLPAASAKVLLRFARWIARWRGRPLPPSPTIVDYLQHRALFRIERAKERLGYTPRVSLEEGMRRTEAWLREAGYL
ncbi:MAG: NAD-dependent epimerase/dehydratase family protein [Blastocatellia bacterium]|nr:NAD-dependent epimerase/dehydratase family protein [Blastocatellia bacterium]MCS7157712.1 NAD-dependent epimerase/dehydratase family protein [Blastocatellia bacterium]MCX7751977.1 NAD-dependent epimerase/dehydratase family protein [Blastocatellia bacterium]MDW8167083.1 NAD-dependent epimerase/dehydratase family protein [Acidobacteriota bacterium]MDW8257187.1 NAD-dependent epimerase/dehydratase family protein [Acidobacteriota bacterium]